ncbi:hypothetical protein ABL78_6480 [Leptomonas seymouri]|uniref:Uncharacterized protein n=1 Tax=Leptomonas seymouri TaxID=5684 RepID=A0A0N1HVC2_LEPSE|nr:hypothetical protein ABL78_6480 [Leptomonas seymouri]|eukprot:KPI84474.1 hypothetical protein ABL78_6480 [Leptomonas seymouri]
MFDEAAAKALCFVRQSLAERRQGLPSPSLAAQHLTEPDAGVSLRLQQLQEQEQREDEEVNAAWARLAASRERHVANSTRERGSSAVSYPVRGQPSPPPKRSPPPLQALQRVPYDAGSPPDASDSDELPYAAPSAQRAGLSVSGDGTPSLPVSGEYPEALGGAPSCSATGGAGGELPASHRRRTTLSAIFASSASGTSTSLVRTQSVMCDETLAEAMISTANRMEAHQQQQQRRRCSSAMSPSVGHRKPSSYESAHLYGKEARATASKTGCPSSSCRGNTSEACGGAGASVQRAVTAGSALSLQETPISAGNGNRSTPSTTAVVPHGSARLRRTMHGDSPMQAESSALDIPDYQMWLQLSAPASSPISSDSSSKRERALACSSGGLPPLPEAIYVSRRSSLVPPPQPPSRRKSSASSTRSPLACALAGQSPVSSSHAIPVFPDVADGVSAVQASKRGSHGSGGSDAQLSHHQLTEAFYGSYKSGKMARDAYLYYILQQQQKKKTTTLTSATSSQLRGGAGAADMATPAHHDASHTPSSWSRSSVREGGRQRSLSDATSTATSSVEARAPAGAASSCREPSRSWASASRIVLQSPTDTPISLSREEPSGGCRAPWASGAPASSNARGLPSTDVVAGAARQGACVPGERTASIHEVDDGYAAIRGPLHPPLKSVSHLRPAIPSAGRSLPATPHVPPPDDGSAKSQMLVRSGAHVGLKPCPPTQSGEETAAGPSEGPQSRLGALWQQSELIYKQRLQQYESAAAAEAATVVRAVNCFPSTEKE